MLGFFYRIYQAVSKLPDLLNSLETSYQDNPQPTLSSCFITPLKEQITELDKYQEMVQSTIDLDSVDKGEYLIKSEFDQDLQGNFSFSLHLNEIISFFMIYT